MTSKQEDPKVIAAREYFEKVSSAIKKGAYDGNKRWMIVFRNEYFGIADSILYFATKADLKEFIKEFHIENERIYFLLDLRSEIRREMREDMKENT